MAAEEFEPSLRAESGPASENAPLPGPVRSVTAVGVGGVFASLLSDELLSAGMTLKASDPQRAAPAEIAARPITFIGIPSFFGQRGMPPSAQALEAEAENLWTQFQASGAPQAVLVTGISEEPSSEAPRSLWSARARAWYEFEKLLLQLRGEDSDHQLMVLRMGDLYGYFQPGFVAELLAGLREGGQAFVDAYAKEQVYHPLHIRDAALALSLAAGAGEGTLSILSGVKPSLYELLAALQKNIDALGYPSTAFRMPPDTPVPDEEESLRREALTRIGFSARVRFDQGVPEVLHGLLHPKDLEHDFAKTSFELDQGDQEKILSEEARFWDAQEQSHEELFARPHDWRFDPKLGERLQKPVYDFVRKHLTQLKPKTVLDVGCGNGSYSLQMAREAGIKVIGIDLSKEKIARAQEMARLLNVEHLVTYQVANALDFQVAEKVDCVVAFGALHHLPNLGENLERLLNRNLLPGGHLICIEPNHEGPWHPRLSGTVGWLGRGFLRKLFDVERYIMNQRSAEGAATLRSESPAGALFHDDDFELDQFLLKRYELRSVRYIHAFAPFFANVFIIYMKPRWLRWVARKALWLVVPFDGWLSRRTKWKPYAAEGLYALRYSRSKDSSPT